VKKEKSSGERLRDSQNPIVKKKKVRENIVKKEKSS
jgi:hypothetical protein